MLCWNWKKTETLEIFEITTFLLDLIYVPSFSLALKVSPNYDKYIGKIMHILHRLNHL